MSTAYEELVQELQQIATLESCGSVLGWEQETYMPPGGAELRSEQLSLIAGLCHSRSTSPRIGELIDAASAELGDDSTSDRAVNVREARRNYERACKLPDQLVREISRVTSLGQQMWSRARKQNDFPAFAPWLQQIIELKREQARCLLREGQTLYDALLDEYEPEVSSASIQATFAPLKESLVALVRQIAQAKSKPDRSLLQREFPKASQQAFSRLAAEKIGFDFERGRIDESAHPFCSGFGPGDCRLTTRYNEREFNMAFFGTLHEAGHGMYEQGLNPDAFGLGMGRAVSLGIHESQSRMWENLVGRSYSFWQYFFPLAQQTFVSSLSDVTLDQFYRAINIVEPSLIRVEADEVTYNLHIMLRFELEQLLMNGDLNAVDVPGVWNERFEAYFGMVPPDDARGCMQDVHWSAGLIGYFPTYALGNLFASQFYSKAVQDCGGFQDDFVKGDFSKLKNWLRSNIHSRGQQYLAADLVKVVTGSPLDSEPLLTHLETKFTDVYRIG